MPISYGASTQTERTWFRTRRYGQSLATRFVIAAALLAALPAHAQEPQSLPPVTVDAPPPKLVLPNSNPDAGNVPASTAPMVGSRPQPGAGDHGQESCADATNSNNNSLGCINERFRRKVDEVNPVLNTPPIDAKSSDLKVGTVNIPAVQQQYGKNFGHSAVPYRPTIIYPSVLGHH
jgi:hypothetical protein